VTPSSIGYPHGALHPYPHTRFHATDPINVRISESYRTGMRILQLVVWNRSMMDQLGSCRLKAVLRMKA
jgi:hypothetical protein